MLSKTASAPKFNSSSTTSDQTPARAQLNLTSAGGSPKCWTHCSARCWPIRMRGGFDGRPTAIATALAVI
eukprot:4079636-Alexandrium_andersonii.AAC.1